jgi:hypothetical protein
MPGVREWITRLDPADNEIALVTNQGGVGLRYWMESGGFGDPSKYPTEQEVMERLNIIRKALIAGTQFRCPIHVCFRYLSQKGNWSPTPFDPSSAEIAAFADNDHDPQQMIVDESSLPARWRKSHRKPEPGMLHDAIFDFRPSRVVMVGNSEDDRKAAEAANAEYIDGDELFSYTIKITFRKSYAYSWLADAARVGLDEEATVQRYADLLRSRINYERARVKIVTKEKFHVNEFVQILGLDDSPMAEQIHQVVLSIIRNEWINRSWLVYENAKAHIDALWAGRHLQQLIIVFGELVTVYGAEAAREVRPYLEQIEEEYRKRYRFVLDGGS